MSTRPLDILIHIGGWVFVFALIFTARNLYNYVVFEVPPGFTSVILVISLFGSATVAMLGLIGRYLSNIYTEVKRRPLYHVQERLGYK